MKRREFGLLLVVLLLMPFSLITGCGNREDQGATQSQDSSSPGSEAEASEAEAPEPSTAKRVSESPEDQYVMVTVQCIVHHSGYRGTIVASGVSKPTVSKPTEGTVVSLECNGENVEITSKAIVDGHIETTKFGRIGVRFRSPVATVGAGDFALVREGISIPQRAIEVYVHKSKQKDFMDRFSK